MSFLGAVGGIIGGIAGGGGGGGGGGGPIDQTVDVNQEQAVNQNVQTGGGNTATSNGLVIAGAAVLGVALIVMLGRGGRRR